MLPRWLWLSCRGCLRDLNQRPVSFSPRYWGEYLAPGDLLSLLPASSRHAPFFGSALAGSGEDRIGVIYQIVNVARDTEVIASAGRGERRDRFSSVLFQSTVLTKW